MAVKGQLQDALQMGCNALHEKFSVVPALQAQYIRFRPTSYIHRGAGLQFITWFNEMEGINSKVFVFACHHK